MLTKLRPLIGLSGRARSGKDTAAGLIVATGAGRYQYSFADPLRDMLHAGFGIDMRDPYWLAKKEDVIPAFGKSPRQMLQTLGTEWGRNLVNDELWVVLAQQRLNIGGPGMVIADIRFENEARWLRRLGGTLVHIERGSAPAVSPHASEGGVTREAVDKVLFNNGSINDLQRSVSQLFD